MPKHWFTADLHIGHANIIKFCGRPFHKSWYPYDPDVEAMNRALVDAWNAVVAPDDEVWVLGDLALGDIEDSLLVASELRGVKNLIPGNHDRVWKSEAQRWYDAYADAGFIVLEKVIPLGECHPEFPQPGLPDDVVLAHLPLGDSHDEDRFESHRPVPGDYWLLHGHVHERWLQRGKMINVGVDAWQGRPASAEEVRALMLAGPNDLPCPPWTS